MTQATGPGRARGQLSQLRCPSCSALVPADAAWCSQCYADLRPAPAFDPLTSPLSEVLASGVPEAEAVAVEQAVLGSVEPVAPVAAAVDHAAAPVPAAVDHAAAPTLAAVPSHAVPARHLDAAAPPEGPQVGPAAAVAAHARPATSTGVPDEDEVDAMLAMLAAEHRRQEKWGSLTDQVADPGRRFALTAAGVVVIATGLFAVLAVLGTLLR